MSKKPPPSYADNPLWASITPILLRTPADPNHDLASIAYSDHYLEATSYLRAVMATNEISQRALDLTADVIGMNPAHYTVWLYRAKVVVGLGEKEEEGEEGKEGALEKRLRNELEWLNVLAKKYLKNYQIWYYISSQRSPSVPIPASNPNPPNIANLPTTPGTTAN
jgi:protein farnesyltransferase/geranylgeranyltransferase type-1 subunit alpha